MDTTTTCSMCPPPEAVNDVQAFFDQWEDEGQVDILQKLSELIILTASRCLLGKEVRENLFNTVYKYFHDLDMGMRPISVFFPYLPIEAHRKRDAARAELARIFSKVRSFALICCATDDGTRDCADGHMHMLRRSSGYSAP
eukprot:scaffold3551_cov408-Prasinococcus_capsulatus_cf.AAC.4